MRSEAMIRWKLHELMAAQRKRNKDLAQALAMSESRVSRLRKNDTMPAMKPETLNGICKFLRCQPGDLLIYEDDPDNNDSRDVTRTVTASDELKQYGELDKTKSRKRTRSVLTVISEVPESA